MKRRILLLISILLLTSCGEKTLTCDRGELSGEQCIIHETKEVSYKCQPGYDYDKKLKQCVNLMTIDAKPKFICNKGYYQGDGKCISTKVYAQTYERHCISKNISDDDELSTTEAREDGCYEKICLEVADDGTCAEFKETKIDYTVDWACPDGTKQIDGECRKTSYQGKSYSCEIGTLDGKKCIIEKTSEATIKCDDGYTLNEKDNICERTIYEEAYLK